MYDAPQVADSRPRYDNDPAVAFEIFVFFIVERKSRAVGVWTWWHRLAAADHLCVPLGHALDVVRIILGVVDCLHLF